MRAIEFTPIVRDYIERYERVGRRDAYLWRWAVRGLELTQLSLVPRERAESLADTKLLAVILNVLVDDLADERGSEPLLSAALSIPFSAPGAPPPEVPEELRAYFELIADLWGELERRCRALPGYADYRMLLEFDFRQVFNAMRYGLLLHWQPGLANPAEHELYPPHNMNMVVFGTMDLMAGSGLDAGEIGPLRGMLWRAQCMGQLSNMLVTWEREVPSRDFSSRVFALALAEGVVSADELLRLPCSAIVERIRGSNIEQRLLEQWLGLEAELRAVMDRLPSLDTQRYIEGLRSLLGMTLASRYHL